VELAFGKHSKVVKPILKILEQTADFEPHKRLAKIYCNLFFDEYKEMYFFHQLDELFITNNEKFTKVNTEGIEIYPKLIYQNLMGFFLRLDLTYEILFDGKKYTAEDKPLIKVIFLESLLRTVFSKEKEAYVSEPDYEIKFLRHIINKCVAFYKENYAGKTSSLFRKDDVLDDLIKYTLFMFRNSMVNKSLVIQLKKVFGSTNVDFFEIDSFIMFFDVFLTNLEENIPITLKIMLKLIQDSIKEHFPNENNYSPLFTYLIFNFFISPKIQEIYNISPGSNKNIREFNRLLRNICFNEKFQDSDQLSKFNELIPICNEKLSQLIDKIFYTIKDCDFTKCIKEEIFFKQPKFLYFYDASFVLAVIKKIEGFNLHNMLIEITPNLNSSGNSPGRSSLLK